MPSRWFVLSFRNLPHVPVCLQVRTRSHLLKDGVRPRDPARTSLKVRLRKQSTALGHSGVPWSSGAARGFPGHSGTLLEKRGTFLSTFRHSESLRDTQGMGTQPIDGENLRLLDDTLGHRLDEGEVHSRMNDYSTRRPWNNGSVGAGVAGCRAEVGCFRDWEFQSECVMRGKCEPPPTPEPAQDQHTRQMKEFAIS